MLRSISERIAKLRKEIAEIQLATRSPSMSIPYLDREAIKARHKERLEEIMEELSYLAGKSPPQ
jgi:hypothetical protein